MRLFTFIILLLCGTSLIGQSNTISIYIGGQLPTEVAVLDLSGEGPSDVFRPGFNTGISYEFNKKIMGFRADVDLNSNGMKDLMEGSDRTTFNGRLYNLYLKTYLQFRLIKKQERPLISMGIGPGYIVASVPETTFTSTVIGSDALVLSRRVEASLALCSSFRLNLPISENLAFYAAINNDLIGYYADRESVIYSNLNAGLSLFF